MSPKKVKWFDQGHKARGPAKASPQSPAPLAMLSNHSSLPCELSHSN